MITVVIVALALIMVCLFLKTMIMENKVVKFEEELKKATQVVAIWNANNLEKELGKEQFAKMNDIMEKHKNEDFEIVQKEVMELLGIDEKDLEDEKSE